MNQFSNGIYGHNPHNGLIARIGFRLPETGVAAASKRHNLSPSTLTYPVVIAGIQDSPLQATQITLKHLGSSHDSYVIVTGRSYGSGVLCRSSELFLHSRSNFWQWSTALQSSHTFRCGFPWTPVYLCVARLGENEISCNVHRSRIVETHNVYRSGIFACNIFSRS